MIDPLNEQALKQTQAEAQNIIPEHYDNEFMTLNAKAQSKCAIVTMDNNFEKAVEIIESNPMFNGLEKGNIISSLDDINVKKINVLASNPEYTHALANLLAGLAGKDAKGNDVQQQQPQKQITEQVHQHPQQAQQHPPQQQQQQQQSQQQQQQSQQQQKTTTTTVSVSSEQTNEPQPSPNNSIVKEHQKNKNNESPKSHRKIYEGKHTLFLILDVDYVYPEDLFLAKLMLLDALVGGLNSNDDSSSEGEYSYSHSHGGGGYSSNRHIPTTNDYITPNLANNQSKKPNRRQRRKKCKGKKKH
eukprot:gene2763-3437_t